MINFDETTRKFDGNELGEIANKKGIKYQNMDVSIVQNIKKYFRIDNLIKEKNKRELYTF